MKRNHIGKLTLAIVVIAIMMSALTLSACGTASPSDVVTAELDAFKTEGTDELSKIADAGNGITFPNEFLVQIQDYTYKIGDEKIDGDKATVDVTIDTYEMGSIYWATSEDVIRAYFEAVKNGEDAGSEQKLTEDIFGAFFEGAKSAEKTYSKTVTVTLEKVDGQWAMSDEGNDDLFDAIFGGFMTATKEQSEKMEDEEYINELAGI